ncbi:MAG: DUF389 domain-containing protein [Methylococcales bacterium]|nr:DUF389 domain-containing protein [Methylococcales bacterium]
MTYAPKALLIYSDDLYHKLANLVSNPALKETHCQIIPVAASLFLKNPEQYTRDTQHILCYVDTTALRELIELALTLQLSIGLLRTPGFRQPHIFRHYEIPRNFNQSLELALRLPEQRLDVLRCNGQLVLGSLIIGEFPFFHNRDLTQRQNAFGRRLSDFLHSTRRLFAQRPKPITLTTAKGKIIKTAATGIAIIENADTPIFLTDSELQAHFNDRQITALLVAPSSITRYLSLLFKPVWPGASRRKLQGFGAIKTNQLTISSNAPLLCNLDGAPFSAKELSLVLTREALAINVGERYQSGELQIPEKEQLMIDNLPQNETRLKYLTQALPFFPHALEEDFKDLLISLRDNAQFSGSYVLLMILSTVLASLGLFLDSASVVIGAMVLAPLMSPIISCAMGLLRSDGQLTRDALTTLTLGMGLTLSVSALMAGLLPYEKTTVEILARTHPTLLDLGVAIVSGIAGAYAHAKTHIARSLPGVAIAVALVPPLCVSGIGLGWQAYSIFSNALLLFFTNLVGIVLAALITFLILGFAPFARAAKGMSVSLLLAALIAAPLSFSFERMIQAERLQAHILNTRFTVQEQHWNLTNVHLNQQADVLTIHADVVGATLPDNQALEVIHEQLRQTLQRPVELSLVFRIQR